MMIRLVFWLRFSCLRSEVRGLGERLLTGTLGQVGRWHSGDHSIEPVQVWSDLL